MLKKNAAQRSHLLKTFGLFAHGQVERRCQADCQRDGLGAGTPPLLLMAPEEKRLQLGMMPDQQRPDSLRTVKLMGADGKRRHPKFMEIDGDLTGGGRGVAVEKG